MSDNLLRLDQVVKRFGTRIALDHLDLTLRAGEVFALLGPNGAGKTTTINLILGFLQPDEGGIEVCGIDVPRDPIAARAMIAYLPEQVALYPALTGIDNLRYFTTVAGLALDHAELKRLLQEAGLSEEAHRRKASTYSKGMRQKVGVAIALARNARLLLLDEPTSGLDPSASAEFSGLVRAAAKRDVAVLMATHDLYRVREVADRVGILSGGRLARELDPRTVDHIELEQLYIGQLAA